MAFHPAPIVEDVQGHDGVGRARRLGQRRAIRLSRRRHVTAAATVGSELLVNAELTSGNQFEPAIAMNADSSFVVVWSSYGSVGNDSSAFSIQGHLFDSAGSASGSQFQSRS